MGAKMKLMDGWQKFYKYWSVRLGALGAAVASVLIAFPDIALNAWAILPDDLKAFIPPNYMPLIGVAIFVLSMVAKFIPQPKLRAEIQNNDSAK